MFATPNSNSLGLIVLKSLFESDRNRIINQKWNSYSLVRDAEVFVENHEFDDVPDDINDVLECFHVYQLLSGKFEKAKKLFSCVAKFYSHISDENFAEFHRNVYHEYYESFWQLFVKFKTYNNVSDEAFATIFSETDFTLYKLLKYKELVTHYNKPLADYMKSSDQSAEIIINRFLVKKTTLSEDCYLPHDLSPSEFENIIRKYLYSDYPRFNLVKLVSYSLSTKECPLSDKLRLEAKHRAEELFERLAVTSSGVNYGLAVEIKDISVIKEKHKLADGCYQVTYNSKWLEDHLDYPTILNNFIYLFEYTDICMRCTFPVNEASFGIIEKHMGVTGIKEYKYGVAFQAVNNLARISLHIYQHFLLNHQINLEGIIQWFFEDYLHSEFSLDCFEVNIPLNTYSDLDKCRLLPSELDGILKQFKMYVEDGSVDRELYESSSNPVSFGLIPSLIPDKYAYANSSDLIREMHLCFSDQSMLAYLEKYNDIRLEPKSFINLALRCAINIDDYHEYSRPDIKWLSDRGTIVISETGAISLNVHRLKIIKDLYDHDVIRTSLYNKNAEYDKLVKARDICVESSLFSRPEQDYLNYMLNRAEFSNGHDLRNKYIHSTYPKDKKQHYADYIDILRIMIVVLIKLNEEFCYESGYDTEIDM